MGKKNSKQLEKEKMKIFERGIMSRIRKMTHIQLLYKEVEK